MEPVSLWAAVEFTACNGSTEALLTAAARAGLLHDLYLYDPRSLRSYRQCFAHLVVRYLSVVFINAVQ